MRHVNQILSGRSARLDNTPAIALRLVAANIADWWQARSVVAFNYAVPFAIAFAAAATFLPPAAFGWWYDTNDDVFLRFIVEGVFSPDPNLNTYLVFSNVFLGRAFQFLYGTAPSISWYDVFQTAAIFVSIAAAAFSLARCGPSRLVLVISGLSIASLLIPIAMRHQFTLIASCLTGAGVSLLLSALIAPVHGRLERAALGLLAVICLILGSMVRFDSFVLCLLASAPACLLTARRPSDFWSWQAIVVVISLALAGGAYKLDKLAYQNNPEWSGFRESNQARVNLTEYLRRTEDGRIPLSVLERMESSGMSQNDHEMLTSFFFSNPRFFGRDQLLATDRAVSDSKATLPQLKGAVFRATVSLLFDWRYAVPLLLVAFTARAKREAYLAVAFCMLSFLTLFALALYFKPIPFRVSHGFFYTSTVMAWLSIACARAASQDERLSSQFSRVQISALATLGLVIAFLFLNGRLSDAQSLSIAYRPLSRVYSQDIRDVKAEHVIVVGGWIPYELVFHPFQSIDLIRRTDFQPTGWIDQTPFQQRRLKARGIADLLMAACEDNKTKLIASRGMLPLFRRYLAEHYHVFPNFTVDPKINNLQVFQCRLDR
jgi:hypothetical protein